MGTTRKRSLSQYLQCNGCHLQNFDRKVIIPTGKFDIHEVQLKNIPVKNDSGVSNNSHRKITMDTTTGCKAIPGMYHADFSTSHPSWATSCSITLLLGQHQNHLKWPSLSSLRTLLFLFPTHPSSQLLKIPPSFGKSSTIKMQNR